MAAEKFARQALQAEPAHFDSLHLLGALLLQTQRLEEARRVLEQAHAAVPAHAAILTKLGIVCTHLKLSDDARRYFDASLTIDPGQIEALASRGALFEQLGYHAAAIDDYQAAIQIHPDFVLAHFLLANCQAASGQQPEALPSYDRALELAPGFTDAWHARGNALRDLSRPEEAVQSYEAAIRLDANHYASLCSLADLQVELGRTTDALRHLNRAIDLKPDQQNILLTRARLHYQLSELELAHSDYSRLIQLNPAHAIAFEEIGHVHFRLNQHKRALGNYDQSVALDPSRGSAHLARSGALRALNRLDEATDATHQALALGVDQAAAYANLASIQIALRQLQAATESFKKACELDPGRFSERSAMLYMLNYRSDVSAREVLAESLDWERQHASPLRSKQYRHEPRPLNGRRLRVGYVSADIRRHAVGAFLSPIIENHDRATIETFAYYCHLGRDDKTEALAPKFDHWIESAKLSDDELAARIVADQIDILVDLAGHTAENRLLVFARKPAPVQITYLGYPGTTGLSAIDFRVTDGLADPASADENYTESLLRLPHSLWSYEIAAQMPTVSELPALNRGYLTLGSFNNFNKLDARSIALWARMMREVPRTRLVMATVPEGRARTDLLAEFEALGVEPSRIDLLPWLEGVTFLQELARVDVSLDPVSVNGATTTCESLWLGVPVISRVGSRFLERAGLSILTSAGLPEYACDSDDACVKLVRDLASDLPALADLRATMRERLVKTSLFNGTEFTRSLEALYREAWQRKMGS